MTTTLYTSDHEWLAIDGDVATVGITDYAQSQLGDVVFIELPKVGRTLKKTEAAAVVESVKAASDIYSPVSGEIVEVNDNLNDKPETINEDAYGDGWIFVVKASDRGELDELLDADAYSELIENEDD
jgi:glycine cleavage system H protein